MLYISNLPFSFDDEALRNVFSDYEVRAYLLLILGATVVIALLLDVREHVAWEPALRAAWSSTPCC